MKEPRRHRGYSVRRPRAGSAPGPAADALAEVISRHQTARQAIVSLRKQPRGSGGRVQQRFCLQREIAAAHFELRGGQDLMNEATPPVGQHADDIAVDRFAAAMKTKLAKKRAEGRGGWDNPAQCTVDFLWSLLRHHVLKGDPIDVGNFAMMLWHRLAAADKRDIVAVDHEGKPVHVLCEDCPPIGYPTDKTRCSGCPRRAGKPAGAL
jgi:hypothetical protein